MLNESLGYNPFKKDQTVAPKESTQEWIMQKTIAEVHNLDLSGEADIPFPINNSNSIGEKSSHKMSYKDIAEAGSGWKFHLNFNAEDPDIAQQVGLILEYLRYQGCITAFKIGDGGGKKAGQPGKEATAYIGHREKANLVAPLIEQLLNNVLDNPEGDALEDDIYFGAHVMGRFEVTAIDNTFRQYGAKGYPFCKKDFDYLLELHDRLEWKDPEVNEQNIADAQGEAEAHAHEILVKRYGNFYTGLGNQAS